MLIRKNSKNHTNFESHLEVEQKVHTSPLDLYHTVLIVMSAIALIGVAICFVVDTFTSADLFWSLIVAFSCLIVMLYLWGTYIAISAFRNRYFIAIAVCAILAIFASFLINLVLSWLLEQPVLDVWDYIEIAVLILISVGCFVGDYFMRKKEQELSGQKLLGDGIIHLKNSSLLDKLPKYSKTTSSATVTKPQKTPKFAPVSSKSSPTQQILPKSTPPKSPRSPKIAKKGKKASAPEIFIDVPESPASFLEAPHPLELPEGSAPSSLATSSKPSSSRPTPISSRQSKLANQPSRRSRNSGLSRDPKTAHYASNFHRH